MQMTMNKMKIIDVVTLGRPGSSLSANVATWNCNILRSSDMI